MKQSGFIAIPVTFYIMAGLIAFGGIASYGFYKQVQSNGILKANNKQLEQSILATKNAYDALQNEKRRSEVIVVDNLAEKEIITKEVIKYRDRIKEVIKNVPAEDCANMSVNPYLLCLLNGSCSDDTGTNANLPTVSPDA